MLTTISIPRPHVPFGPSGTSEDHADASYLREVVWKIDKGYAKGIGGSNVTATIRKLIADAADVLEASPITPGRDIEQLIRDLIDPDDCWFDHNGGCQAHGYLELQAGEMCPHAKAKAWLATIGGSGAADASSYVESPVPVPKLLDRDVSKQVEYMVRGPLGTREVPSGETWGFEEKPVARRVVTKTTERWLGRHPEGTLLSTSAQEDEISEVVHVDQGLWVQVPHG